MGIVFECLDKLPLMSGHCGIKQCCKNSMSTWLLLLNWKNSFMPTMLLRMRVSWVLSASLLEVMSPLREGAPKGPVGLRAWSDGVLYSEHSTPMAAELQVPGSSILNDLAR